MPHTLIFDYPSPGTAAGVKLGMESMEHSINEEGIALALTAEPFDRSHRTVHPRLNIPAVAYFDNVPTCYPSPSVHVTQGTRCLVKIVGPSTGLAK